MDRKHQVFVSSTYEDLQEERREVIRVLLQLDCIPSGMELFPAADKDQWSLIKGVIDDCDYYIVIIAGRYGSIGPEGVSYTEKEYHYAVENDKPVVAFLHSDPGSIPGKRLEETEEGKTKLEAFRALVQKKMCKGWATPHELGSHVVISLTQLRKQHPGVGWVRGDQVPDREATEEILSLRKQIEHLEHKLNEVRTEAPPDTEQLAQGDDTFEIPLVGLWGDSFDRQEAPLTLSLNWNQIFYTVSPLLIHESDESSIRQALAGQLLPKVQDYFRNLHFYEESRSASCQINTDCFRTIIVQLRALGLIVKSTRPRSVKDTATYWTLTPFGDNVMNRLRAIKRAGTNEST